MAKKLVGSYKNPTKKDVNRMMVDIEMARKKQELEAKGMKPVSILPANASDGEVLRALLNYARTGETQW